MALSVIIPTRNEAPWLPRLLAVLAASPLDCEIVVADNDSGDQTKEIARDAGCLLVSGGRPSEARNRAARAARGTSLLFIDADVVPSAAALLRVIALDTQTAPPLVHFRHVPMSENPFIKGCYRIADLWFASLRRVAVHQGFASFLFVTREHFEAVGGFDEALEPGEDVDFVRRASSVGVVQYERRAPVFTSARRFVTESPTVFALKTAWWGFLRVVGVRASVLRYQWRSHLPSIAAQEARWLERHGIVRPDEPSTIRGT